MITNAYPYGDWETYLETEVKFLNGFENVKILSLQTREEMLKIKRDIPENFESYPIKYLSKSQYLIRSFYAFFDINFYREVSKLIKNRKFTISKLISLIIFLTRANYEFNKLKKHLSREFLVNSTIYSYRFEYQPYVAIKIKKHFDVNSKIISRAHGYDLYEYRNKNNYIPLREYILENVDEVFPCSQDGSEYLRKEYPAYENKISTRYLGTVDNGISPVANKKIIVSCSRVLEVKRIEKIINALCILENSKIKWIHYGDGPLLDQMQNLAKEKLEHKMEYEFKGFINNKDLLKVYKNSEIYAFINVSSSEGLPVSIMEVISFGIPVIATDVGGTREIVSNEVNGLLLEENISDLELSNKIKHFINLDIDEYMLYRNNSRKIWEKNFDAKENYLDFSENLKKDN